MKYNAMDTNEDSELLCAASNLLALYGFRPVVRVLRRQSKHGHISLRGNFVHKGGFEIEI